MLLTPLKFVKTAYFDFDLPNTDIGAYYDWKAKKYILAGLDTLGYVDVH